MMAGSSGFLTLDDELKEFSLEKDVKTTVKTDEELKLMTIDESLNDIQRAIHILSIGQEIQCISVVRDLPALLKKTHNECLHKVVPKLVRTLKSAGMELQLAAIQMLNTITDEKILSPQVYGHHFLATITSHLDQKDHSLVESWTTCLLSAIAYLPIETVQKDVLTMVLPKGNLSKPVSSRLSCCVLLGAVSKRFDPHKVIKEIVSTVKQLCQDIDFNVRARMCLHLHFVAETIGKESTKVVLLPEILELAADEEIQVRSAALFCILQIRKMLDTDFLKETVSPLICHYCENGVYKQDSSLLSISENVGRFCHEFSAYYSSEKKLLLLRVYRQMCKFGRSKTSRFNKVSTEASIRMSANSLLSISPSFSQLGVDNREKFLTCRRNCAFNYPALVLFCGRDLFQKELLGVLSLLSCDPDFLVRKYIASGFHEVALKLQSDAASLHPHFSYMLQEKDSAIVLEALLNKLPTIVNAIFIHGNLAENKANSVIELCNHLLNVEQRLQTKWPCSWRPVATFASHIASFPDFLTPEQIYHKIFPLTFKFLTVNQYLPVRLAAAKSVCILIRRSRRFDHRREMCDRIIKDLCHSPCYRNRILFFTVCSNIMKQFSRAFFKDHFFTEVLNLVKDPVANIRILLWNFLPRLKKILVLPHDRHLHGHLESSVRKMLGTETDKDVVEAMQRSISDMDRIKVVMESITGQTLPVDDEDRKKELDERSITEEEEKPDEQSSKPIATAKRSPDKAHRTTNPNIGHHLKGFDKQNAFHGSEHHMTGPKHDSQSSSKSLDPKRLASNKTSSQKHNNSSDSSSIDSMEKDGKASTKRALPSSTAAQLSKSSSAISKFKKSPNEDKKNIAATSGTSPKNRLLKKKP